MLEFNTKKTVETLQVEQDGISIVISEQRIWNQKQRKYLDETNFRVCGSFIDDANYSNVEVVVKTVEEAKLVSEDIFNFMKLIKSAVLIEAEEEK
jgi:hypothetical protein